MRSASIGVLALVLTGCALTTTRLGSYAVAAPAPEAQAMAADSVVELVKLFPPAISRLSIDASASDDGFGQALTDGLRKSGYAVVEASGKGRADPAALPLRYVVDQPMTGFYRVMLHVGDQSLTRGYTTQGGVAPSAGWALNLSGASPQLVERATRPDLPPGSEIFQAEAAAIDAGIVPVSAASPTRTPDATIDVATVEVLPSKVAEYQAADAMVTRISAKVAEYQVALVRAKERRAVAAAGWRVQFAAFRTERTARRYWRSLVQKRPALAALKPRFPRSSHGVVFVQAGPYRTVGFAKRVCGGLNANACIVVKA